MNWLLLAIFLSVLQTTSPILRQAPNHSTSTPNGINQESDKKQPPTPSQATKVSPINPIPNQNAGQQPSADNTQGDITITKPVSISVKRGLIDNISILLTGILAVVGIIGVCIALGTLKAINRQVDEMKSQGSVMQGQLDTMKGQLELEHRPWIAVTVEPSSPVVFDERGCVLLCKVTMTNVGHSVAKHVSLWTDFALLGVDNPITRRNELSEIMRQPQNEASDYGWLLFPNQSAIEQRPIIAIPERVEKALNNKTFQGMNAIGLHLVGCVDYPSPIDGKKRHQTRFVYNISFVDQTNGRVMGAFDPARKIYQPIVLLPTMHGASAD